MGNDELSDTDRGGASGSTPSHPSPDPAAPGSRPPIDDGNGCWTHDGRAGLLDKAERRITELALPVTDPFDVQLFAAAAAERLGIRLSLRPVELARHGDIMGYIHLEGRTHYVFHVTGMSPVHKVHTAVHQLAHLVLEHGSSRGPAHEEEADALATAVLSAPVTPHRERSSARILDRARPLVLELAEVHGAWAPPCGVHHPTLRNTVEQAYNVLIFVHETSFALRDLVDADELHTAQVHARRHAAGGEDAVQALTTACWLALAVARGRDPRVRATHPWADAVQEPDPTFLDPDQAYVPAASVPAELVDLDALARAWRRTDVVVEYVTAMTMQRRSPPECAGGG